MHDASLGRRWILAGILALSTASAPVDHAYADDLAFGPEWEATVTLYGWALGLDGDVKAKGRPFNVDVGFDTILENLEIGGMAEVDVYRGNLGLFFNGVYGKDTAGATGAVGPIPVNVDVEATLTYLDFGVKYRFDPIPLGAADPSGFQPHVVVEPLAGIRYTNIDTEVDLTVIGITIPIQERYEFVDPIVGVRALWRPADRWRLITHVDVGGFGAGSDFSWNVIGAVGYDFSMFGERDASVILGYRALGQDYSTGPLGTVDAWNIITHGPLAGLTLRF